MKSNPLATRFVAPGKLAWRAAPGQSLDELSTRFAVQLKRRAAIVGPHGSGKSTLLEHLVPLLGTIALRAATYEEPNNTNALSDRRASKTTSGEQRIVWLKMRGGMQSRRLLFQTYRSWAHRNCVLVIDGYEQLSRVARGAALLLTRISGTGILITSHQPTALPTLAETQADVPLAQELINQLLPEDLDGRNRLLDGDRLQQLLAKHHGNLREVFMELYDELERTPS